MSSEEVFCLELGRSRRDVTYDCKLTLTQIVLENLVPLLCFAVYMRKVGRPARMGLNLYPCSCAMFPHGSHTCLSCFFLPPPPPLFCPLYVSLLYPPGYLPGQYYGNLPFFFGLATVYLALGIVWMVVCMLYIKVRGRQAQSARRSAR